MRRLALLFCVSVIGCQPAVKDGLDASGLGGGGDGATDGDGDGYVGDDDCNDADAAVNPGAVELCDGIDNNCDGAIDEEVTDTWYPDEDGDGFGDPESAIDACEPPPGAVSNGADCDDADPDVNPGATEACDDVDNDCDGDVDEDMVTTWYADTDGDGYGDPLVSQEACAATEGWVADNTDCDDTTDAAHPGAEEICDEIDNDCDSGIDEDVALTWYEDRDDDDWGVALSTTEACARPTGYAPAAGDCDDEDEDINPDADEECNSIDDDCDGSVDEADAVDASIWYADSDSDGFGDATVTAPGCTAPSGYVADATDCDDGAFDVNPDATEVCNEIDDDCDTLIDDADGTLDPSTGGTWYVDGDGDGFGDPATGAFSCEAPSGTVAEGTDCDDGEFDVNPDATEVCNEIDDDCDDLIDDADDSLDTSTGSTWYADADEDGEGDPAVTVEACEVPSGYVDNDTDCDDSDATDTDGDGIQDCADDDRDGDGLDDEWDADPDDPDISRGPTGGLGTEGPLVVAGTLTQEDWTLIDGGASAADSDIDVLDGTIFAEGDEVLILSQQGADAGAHQFAYLAAVTGDVLTIQPPLETDYSSSSVVLVQRVPHYTTVSVASGTTLAAADWAGEGGGVVVFRASGAVTIDGTVDAAAAGFEGGAGVYGNGYDPDQGESFTGPGASGTTSANGGGGGSYPRRGDNADSGGGGSYGTSGGSGTSYPGSAVCSPGATYGDADLGDWFLGSGGGGGSPDTEGDGSFSGNYSGDGGDGGGLVAIFSGASITVSGSVTADGEDGDDAASVTGGGHSHGGEVGGGGAGSGGQILLVAPALSFTGSVRAQGADGGSSASNNVTTPYGSAFGGDGGEGRIRLEYDTLTGSTAPSAGSTGAYED